MAASPESWERWKADWQHAFFAIVLGLVTLGAVAGTGQDGGGLALRLGLPAVLAAWYGYWFGWRRDDSPSHLPYLIGAAALWAAMAAVDPALLYGGLAVLVPYCLRRTIWLVVGIVAAGVLWLWQRSTETRLDSPTVAACALGTIAAVAVAGYVATLDHEGRKRQRLLDELAASQAELAAAERQAGMLAERQRLARDIHDTLTQGFASISLLLEAAQADLPSNGPPGRRIDQAIRTARENLGEARRLVLALQPEPLDQARLPDAVRQLTERLGEETEISASTVVTGRPVRLGAPTEGEVLRVVQEALTNVRRHAHATAVTVTLSYLDEMVLVDVQDDGDGFAVDERPPGVGLAAMRERIDGLGGTLTVESTPGEGTTIAVTAPAP